MSDRDNYEVANQLQGYVDMTTPEELAQFLLREAREAEKLADHIAALEARNARLEEALGQAKWAFAQIGQMHSTDNGDIAERCMELGQKGYREAARTLTTEQTNG